MSKSKAIQLSFSQERLWFIDQYENGSAAYNTPMVLSLKPQTNPLFVMKAIEHTVSRHEILRTLIKTDSEGRGIQCVMTLAEQAIESAYLTMSKAECKAFIHKEVHHIFQLEKEYPIRAFLLQERDSGNHYLCLVIHHIAFDGWSMNVFLNDVQAYYFSEEAKLSGIILSPDLPQLSIQYKDFAVWQRNYFTNERLFEQMQYWKNFLADYTALSFPTDKTRPQQICYAGDEVTFILKEEISQRLRVLAKQLKVSLYSVLLSGYYLFLRAYSGQDDLIIGTPMANRQYAQLEHLIGYFVNSLPLRSHVSGEFRLTHYIQSVSKNVMEAQMHQDLPFEKLVNELKVSTDTSRHPIFQILFNMQGQSFTTGNQSLFEPLIETIHQSTAKFDLTVTMYDSQSQLKGGFNYATSLFTEPSIERFCETYQYILEQISMLSSSSQMKVQDLQYLKSSDYQRIIYDWNETQVNYPAEETLVSLFERQVREHPQKEALIYEGISLTYEELNAQANQLGHYLRRMYEIKTDDLLAVYLDRSEYMVVGLLGILKAGGAYVPLDPQYPAERVLYILKDTKARVVLTQLSYLESLKKLTEKDCVELDSNIFLSEKISNPSRLSGPENLAYVIYTSGTTGQPKGVMIENRGIVNRLDWMQTHYVLKPTDRILQKTPYFFDVSVWEFFWGLCYGASIVLAKPEGHCDPGYLIRLIENAQVSIIHFVPSMLNGFHHTLADCRKKINLSSLRYIYCSGEALALRDVKALHKYLPFVAVHNLYGPTEASVDVLYADNVEKVEDIVPIGRPIANTFAYILNNDLSPLPIGSVGELFIGGVGLARGYLNQPELTAKKFLVNPFQHGWLYKTGDLARYLADGNIEYIGRNDFQVKLRGYRIELDEIEKVLLNFLDIKQSVVLMRGKEENAYLVGYYVSDYALNEVEIESYLRAHLPEYMLPKVLMHLSALPLTTTGKLDRNGLPDVQLISTSHYVAPHNEVERQICVIYAEVLNLPVENIGLQDNFFQLGGNSILAIKLISRLNQKIDVNLKVSDIFKYKNIQQLSAVLESTTEEFFYKNYRIKEGSNSELYKPFSLNNVQRAYYLGRYDKFELGDISTHVYSEFKFAFLDSDKLEKAINLLIKRHLGLRTIFVNGEQKYLEKYPHYFVKTHIFTKENDFILLRDTFSHKIYAPEYFPLFDIMVSHCCFAEDKEYYILHFSCDALLMDAHSGTIFFKELTELYANSEVSLPALSISYRDYIQQWQKIRNSELFTKDKEYWANKLNYYNFEMNLPLRCKVSEVSHPKFSRSKKIIAKTIWNKLKTKILENNLSLTSVVLFAYGRVLSYWSNQEHVCINLTLFNRLPLHSQVNDILGDFTVLELFNYKNSANDDVKILDELKLTHEEVWNDIEHNLFDGIDVQNWIRETQNIPTGKIIAPVVLTSILDGEITDNKSRVLINSSYLGQVYSITQTSQVFIDNKAYETEEGFVAEWDYVEQLFEPSIIEQMQEDYCKLLEYLSEADWNKEVFLKLTVSKRDLKIIHAANSINMPLREQTLFTYYETYVKTHNLVKRIAVVDGAKNDFYTYNQLINDSDFLSKYLNIIINKMEKNSLIGILSEKSYNHVVGTLGIMKSGCGYLPLNIEWPVGRLDEIFCTAKLNLILISKSQSARLIRKKTWSRPYTFLIIEEILMQKKDNSVLKQQVMQQTLPVVSSNDIAYVIYTSGSTGIPKGVTISHGSALNTILAVNAKYQVHYEDKILALSDLSFDLSVYDIFGMLAVGASIVFPCQEQLRETRHWVELVDKYHITLWNSVPQLAALLMDAATANRMTTTTLRLFLLSGDWIPTYLPNKIKELCPQSTVVSLGGATEGSIWSIWYEITYINNQWEKIPYGVAMPNQKMYVLNYDGTHSSVGVLGEIYIGGVGVALNYFQDEKRTQLSFIQHPKLGRLYKTGDLGKWNENGYMDLIGRLDNQVKINGYRVELDEISAKLNKLPGVKEAITQIIRNESQHYIVSYLVPTDVIQLNKLPVNFEEFKLLSIGLKKDLAASYLMPIVLHDFEYRLHKSYRSYISDASIDEKVIEQCLYLSKEKIKECLMRDSSPSSIHSFTKDNLCRLLKPLSWLQLEDRVLPKVLYPSAGNSYSVRCYVAINQALEDLSCGYYYYNPLLKALCSSEEHSYLKNKTESLLSLYFITNWEAIVPLYQEESKRFVYLEVGHILALLAPELRQMDVFATVTVIDEVLDKSHTLLMRLDIKYAEEARASVNEILPINDSVNVKYFKRGDNDTYLNVSNRNDSINLSSQSIFFQVNGYGGRLLSNGNGIFSACGESNINNLVYSGMLFQLLSQELYQYSIGSCMLGFKSNIDTLYTMVLGKVDNAESLKSESSLKSRELKDLIEKYLAKSLPSYMLPNFYEVLKEVPITANGKIDIKSLSLPDFQSAALIVDPPKTATETQLAALWTDVLNLELCTDVSVSFFELGGTSLSSMILLGRINTVFSTELTLRELFENFTIRHIAEKIERKRKSTWTPLVSVGIQDKSKPNLYILPGVIGCSSAYYPLGHLLSKTFSVNLIEAKGLYGDTKPHHILDEMLNDYFEAIKNNTQTQNILLVAHSAGCRYAVELACRLESLGFMIQAILLDGPILSHDSTKKIKSVANGNILLNAIKELYALSNLEKVFDHTRSTVIEKIADYLFADQSISQEYKLKVASGFLNVFNIQNDFAENFQLSPIIRCKGKAMYVACERENIEKEISSYAHVFECFSSTVSRGGHLTMLDKHHVVELAEKILRFGSMSSDLQ